jgi:LysR family hydrogen peroxide-inducible transcriptional activator
LTLKQIEYVLAVAKEKSFRGAAQVRFVSQPTLSSQIQKMEGLVSALKSAILETLPNELRLP